MLAREEQLREYIDEMEISMRMMSGKVQMGEFYKNVSHQQHMRLERQAAQMEQLRAENRRLREEKEAAEAIANKPKMDGLLEAIVDQQNCELKRLRKEVLDLKNKNAELQMENVKWI